MQNEVSVNFCVLKELASLPRHEAKQYRQRTRCFKVPKTFKRTYLKIISDGVKVLCVSEVSERYYEKRINQR